MTYIFNSFRINPPCLLRRKMKESHGTEPLTCGSWNFWVTIVKWNRIKNTQLVSGNCLVVWKTHTHIHWEAELQVKLLTLILSSLYDHVLSHPVLQFLPKKMECISPFVDSGLSWWLAFIPSMSRLKWSPFSACPLVLLQLPGEEHAQTSLPIRVRSQILGGGPNATHKLSSRVKPDLNGQSSGKSSGVEDSYVS